MKRVAVLILIVAGTTLSLNAQSGGRAVLPGNLISLSEDNPEYRVDQVGPLCNQPCMTRVSAWIDPQTYNQKNYMIPGCQEYRPYNPLKDRKNISAPMPQYKER